MALQQTIKSEFVDFIPEVLAPGILYVSMQYKSVAHLCCCGCGSKVVTPLSPTGWRLSYNGKAISLSPSIGNWKLECQSHYWIEDNQIEWAGRWTAQQIERGFAHDQQDKAAYFQDQTSNTERREASTPQQPEGIWKTFARWWKDQIWGSR
jgi:hypothetical protein